MRKISLLPTAALFFSLATIAHGQQEPGTRPAPQDKTATTTDAPVAEPGEWDTKIYQLEDGKLVALEAQVAVRRVTVGLRGETSAYIYQGPTSSKRIASSGPVFIMRLEKEANPTTLIALYSAEKKKKERQVGQAQIYAETGTGVCSLRKHIGESHCQPRARPW